MNGNLSTNSTLSANSNLFANSNLSISSNLFVIDRSIHADLRHRGEVVLTYAVHYPQYVTAKTSPSLNMINAHYRDQANYLARSVPPRLYADAVSDYDDRKQNGFPFTPYEYLRTFDTTHGQDCVISVFFDSYEFTGGAHGNTLRTADTWDARTAKEIPLSALFPPGTNYVARLEATINAHIAKQNTAQPDTYFEDSTALVHQYFNEENFYLEPDALVIFFQQYEIAPYATGIPAFAIPYAEVGAKKPGCA